MKTLRSQQVICVMLFATFAIAISGCSLEHTVKAAPVTINSMLFGTSDAGIGSGDVGRTVFLHTELGSPFNTDVYSIPMPSRAVLTHLHFAAPNNTLSSAVATISVYVNGTPSMISCTAAASETTCSDTTNSITVNEGDLVTIGMTVATTSSTSSGFVGPQWRASVGVAFQ